MAGRTLRLYELAAGVPAVDGEPAYTPRNPQGLIGVDGSGPPWGAAKRHILASVGFGGANASSLTGPGPICVVDGGIGSYGHTITLRFQNRLFDASTPLSPYSRGIIRIRFYRFSGAGTVDLNVGIMSNGFPRKDEVAVTSASGTSETIASLDAWAELVPGWNKVKIFCWVDTGATFSIAINQVALMQVAKLQHT